MGTGKVVRSLMSLFELCEIRRKKTLHGQQARSPMSHDELLE